MFAQRTSPRILVWRIRLQRAGVPLSDDARHGAARHGDHQRHRAGFERRGDAGSDDDPGQSRSRGRQPKHRDRYAGSVSVPPSGAEHDV